MEALESRRLLTQDLAQYVNPLIGTALQPGAPFGAGDVFPGAVAPFGLVQWSPNTKPRGNPGNPSGYDYLDSTIAGFPITHFSGRGVNYLQDVPIMPYVGNVTVSPATSPTTYYSTFSHANESASAGYYSVGLDNGVQTELTTTQRSGLGQFTFPATPNATLIINATGSVNGNSAGGVTIDPTHNLITGTATSHIGAASNPYTIYFSIEFDRPFTVDFGTWNGATVTHNSTSSTGTQSGAFVTFDATTNQVVHVKVGLSYVSIANAELNAQTEDPGWDFDAIRQATYNAWNDRLNAIQVQGGTNDEMTTFYTALYHTMIHPNVFSDVNGQYIGFDNVVRSVDPGHAQYENIPTWDNDRTEIRLLALLAPDVTSDIARSLILDAQQGGGALPRWEQGNADSRGMVGDGGAIDIATAYALGATDFDTGTALAQMRFGAEDPNAMISGHIARENLTDYLNLGYVPSDHNGQSASVTEEYANADFAIAQFAQSLGDTSTASTYLARSQDWRNLFSPDTLHITPRDSSGAFIPNFNPASESGFSEGNSDQYTWMLPYDYRGLFDAMGGNDAVVQRLDTHFTQLNAGPNRLGGFMGNEPEEYNPWAYDFAGAPWRTQDVNRRIELQLFTNTPGGLPGNDDAGALSSWYVFATIGLNPLIPGVGGLVIGSPLFSDVVVNLGHGQRIHITAPDAADNHQYVQSLDLNGQPTTSLWIPIGTILSSPLTTLDFTLGDTPNTSWGSAPTDAPPSFDVPGTSPTIVQVPSANPNPVTGTSTNLGVLADDVGGEASLTYTWAAVGNPPGPVSFSDNGTNAAKNTTVMFGAPGVYNFLVTVTDDRGYATTAQTTVTVGSPATPVDLSSSFNLVGIVSDGMTFSGGGLDGDGSAYSGNLLGTSLTVGGNPYGIGPADSSDVVQATGQTITLPAGRFGRLTFLAAAVNGNQPNQTFVVNYTDGTSDTFTQSLSDWFTPQGYAGESIGLAMSYRDNSDGSADNRTFYLYVYSLSLNSSKTVSGVTLPGNANVEILAMDVVAGPTQVDLSANFNQTGIVADGSTFSSTGGLDGLGNAYSGNLLGTDLTAGGYIYTLGLAGSNDLVQAAGQTIALPSGSFSALTFLATAVNGNQPSQTFTVNYTDGTSDTFTQSLSDWHTPQDYAGESTALAMAYRDKSNGTSEIRTMYLYTYSFSLDSSKTVSDLTLPSNSRLKILAIDLIA